MNCFSDKPTEITLSYLILLNALNCVDIRRHSSRKIIKVCDIRHLTLALANQGHDITWPRRYALDFLRHVVHCHCQCYLNVLPWENEAWKWSTYVSIGEAKCICVNKRVWSLVPRIRQYPVGWFYGLKASVISSTVRSSLKYTSEEEKAMATSPQ